MAEGIAERFTGGATLWVLSDIHANSVALESALGLISQEEPIIILGDLLTYGCHPAEVMQLVKCAAETRPVAVVLGNHDALYLDLYNGTRDYFESLPEWLQESVRWTCDRVDLACFASDVPWRSQFELGDLLLSHANPKPPPDWSYVDSLAQYRLALEGLAERNFRVGVFGHTHRPRTLIVDGEDEHWWSARMSESACFGPRARGICNIGSLGQPRDQTSCSVMGSIRRQGDTLRISHQVVDYDMSIHLAAITGAGLSRATTEKLLSFYTTSTDEKSKQGGLGC